MNVTVCASIMTQSQTSHPCFVLSVHLAVTRVVPFRHIVGDPTGLKRAMRSKPKPADLALCCGWLQKSKEPRESKVFFFPSPRQWPGPSIAKAQM